MRSTLYQYALLNLKITEFEDFLRLKINTRVLIDVVLHSHRKSEKIFKDRTYNQEQQEWQLNITFFFISELFKSNKNNVSWLIPILDFNFKRNIFPILPQFLEIF